MKNEIIHNKSQNSKGNYQDICAFLILGSYD